MKDIQVYRLSQDELSQRGVQEWDIWEKGPSEFEWFYTNEEHCYVTEGRARITWSGKTVEIGRGDYAVFPAGVVCVWRVDDYFEKRYSFHPQQRAHI